jgi:hypothetical protein
MNSEPQTVNKLAMIGMTVAILGVIGSWVAIVCTQKQIEETQKQNSPKIEIYAPLLSRAILFSAARACSTDKLSIVYHTISIPVGITNKGGGSVSLIHATMSTNLGGYNGWGLTHQIWDGSKSKDSDIKLPYDIPGHSSKELIFLAQRTDMYDTPITSIYDRRIFQQDLIPDTIDITLHFGDGAEFVYQRGRPAPASVPTLEQSSKCPIYQISSVSSN